MELEYNWEIYSIPRHTFYRKIQFKGKSCYISLFKQIERKKFIIYMDRDTKACYFILKSDDNIILEITENSQDSDANFQNIKFTISPPFEFEIDDIYKDFNYNELPFDENEIEIIYDNTEFNEYENSLIEIKLSPYKIN